MNVVIVGVNPPSYIFGNLLSSLGVNVVHWAPGKGLTRRGDNQGIIIKLDHYYSRNGRFERRFQTERMYKPKIVYSQPTSVDLFIFSGCYDQVITYSKRLMVHYPSFSKTKCLVQVKSWKSIEYLRTILISNPVYWISTMAEGYFSNNKEYREVKGIFIKKTALQIDASQYGEAAEFAVLLSELLKTNFFEVDNILQPNRIFISLYTPMVLYIIKYIKYHWQENLKPLAFLADFYKNVQPFLYTHILNNGPFKEVREFASIYKYDEKKLYGLISSILSRPGDTILKMLVQSALHNKYEIDEAIDLATEMIRWYDYFGKDVKGLEHLFSESRQIWENTLLKEFKLQDIKMPKTLLLDKN